VAEPRGAAKLKVFNPMNGFWLSSAGVVQGDHVEELRSAYRALPWARRCNLTLVLLLSFPSLLLMLHTAIQA